MSQSDLAAFARELHQSVVDRGGEAESRGFEEECFVEFVLAMLSDGGVTSAPEMAYGNYVGRGAWKVNASELSADGMNLDLFVAIYQGTGEVSDLSQTEARESLEKLHRFLTKSLKGLHNQLEEANPAFACAQRIYEAAPTLANVRLFLVTDQVLRTRKLAFEPIDSIDVECVVWDLEKLSRLRPGSHEVVSLDFVDKYAADIRCIEHVDPTGEYRTYLAFLDAGLLSRIYGEYGQRLLERNVRAFLQARGKVNSGLQATLKHEPHRFLAYNNGLCCTASDVDVRRTADGAVHLRSVTDFQIVNGGQTTASIHYAVRKSQLDVSHATIQMKLTVVPNPQIVQELVPKISLFANSQNKINTADFAANGVFHRDLERLSRSVWAPGVSGLDRGSHWYYERSRGSYADDRARNSTPAARREWDSQNPRHQKFTKTDLAKSENCWVGLPQFVCLGAEKNFTIYAERVGSESTAGIDLLLYKHIVARLLFFRTAEKLFGTLDLVALRAQSVAYAVSWLVHHSGWRLPLDKIWDAQNVPTSLCDALKVVLAAAHKHFSKMEGNPTEHAKRETCWLKFLEKELPLPENWKRSLAPNSYRDETPADTGMALRWEALRRRYRDDPRTLGELEILANRRWIASRREEPVAHYVREDWNRLVAIKGMGLKKIQQLIDLLSAVPE